MKQKGIGCAFQKLKHFFVYLLNFHFIKLTNVPDQFACPCIKQARGQKFAMGGCFGGLGTEPPALENLYFFFAKIT